MSDALRLFFAVALPAELRAALHRLARGLHVGEADVRWVASETRHLTLRFVGDVASARAGALATAAAEALADLAPVDLSLKGGGVFPRRGPPRVLWVGVDGEVARLDRVAARLDRALVALGYPPQRRAYVPHITLGRVRRGKVGDAVAQLQAQGPLGGFTAHEVVLFRSILEPQGARHEVLERLPLGGGVSGG